MYPPGVEFIVALFGCFYARVLPVPVYPPIPSTSRSSKMSDASQTFAKVHRDCVPSACLTSSTYLVARRAAHFCETITGPLNAIAWATGTLVACLLIVSHIRIFWNPSKFHIIDAEWKDDDHITEFGTQIASWLLFKNTFDFNI